MYVCMYVCMYKSLYEKSACIVKGAQSAIRKKMASRIAFWVDRHVGQKFTVFVWESDGK